MSEPSFATIEDLEARMGRVADASRAAAALADASAMIHLVSQHAWVEDGELVDAVPGVAKTICCSAARRVLTNPNGLTAQQIGGYSESYADATADVYLTKSEQKRIREAAGLSGSLGSITLESPHPLLSRPNGFASVQGQDEPIHVGPDGW